MIHSLAVSLRDAGLSVLPIRADGTKAPTISEWKHLQSQLPTDDELLKWFAGANPVGIGLVGGKVSGGIEVIDFDEGHLFEEWREIVEAIAPGLVDRFTVHVTPRVPSGFHVVYRCATVGGSAKIARIEDTDPAKMKLAIETKGEGGYVILPGSPPACHETNGTYRHASGPALDKVQTITVDERTVLLDAARTFDQRLEVEAKPTNGRHQGNGSAGASERPGDAFGQATDWADILEPHGWSRVFQRGDVSLWRRPGKTGRGISGKTTSINNSAIFVAYSSNAEPFESVRDTRKSYTKLGAFALLDHGGNFGAAAKALADRGFGEPSRNGAGSTKQAKPTAPPVVELTIESVAGGRYKLIATSEGKTFTDEAFLRNARYRTESAKKMAERLRIDPRLATDLLDAKVRAMVSDTGTAVVTRAAEVERTETSWLWHARIPLGSITMLDGLPGCGKSTFTMDLAARVSQGFEMPPYGGASDADPAGVLLISGEVDASATIAPRLSAVGADLSRIHLLTTIEAEGKTRSLAIPIDVPRIEAVVEQHGIQLIVLDPISAYFEQHVETHNDASVRNALLPLAEMASRNQTAVVLIRHLNKRSGDSAINRGSGSIAFIAAARSGLILGRHPDDPGKRVLASLKCNLAPEPKSLEFRLVSRGSVARAEWIGECSVSAEDLVAVKRKQRESATKDDAIELYKDALKDGLKPAVELAEITASAGISESTAGRARKELGLKKRKDGLAGGWEWAMPNDQDAQDLEPY